MAMDMKWNGMEWIWNEMDILMWNGYRMDIDNNNNYNITNTNTSTY